ncbi:MAG: RusA family crossover junction endodeoxyribonuclease [Chloroflexota bacterium]|nr:RusA family crossover junction endodeoxyribonuclease [Chloroflexota bacterium]
MREKHTSNVPMSPTSQAPAGASAGSMGSSLQLRITLPLPPSINEQYATVDGRRVSSQVARSFKKQVRETLRSLERQGVLTDDLRSHFRQSYLALFLDYYFTTPLKRDLDGGLKITLDALCEGLGLNDNRVVDIHLTKHIDPLQPHLYVEMDALPDWQFDREYVVL